MQTIYIDVLIVLNIYVNFILILATSKITRSKVSNIRGILSASYGSIYSLLILFPKINSLLNICIKIFAVVTIVLIAFGYVNFKRTLINTVCFFTSNFIFGGVIFGIYIWLEPSFIHFNNTYFYIDFSLLLLIFITAFIYMMLSIFQYFSDRFSALSDSYRIIIKYKGKITVLDGIADTGNSLVDFFSGKSVIICDREKLSEIIDLSEDCINLKGFRLIPYSTIGNAGMITVFSPDEVLIVSDTSKYKKNVNALIGIQPENNSQKSAIFNPCLLK